MTNLTVSNITKTYNTDVLTGASFTAEPGESVAIIGPSGSGKSTLLHIIGTLDKPNSGKVTLGSRDVTSLNRGELSKFRATEVGFIFQDHHLLPQLTAIENVLIPTIPAGTQVGAREKAMELLERVGVAHRSDAFPSEMSGGERQRVAVARALINGAGLLLCDEPTGNLDRASGGNIIDILLELAAQGVTVIMVTHNTEHASKFHRCLELRDGKLFPAELGGTK